MNTKTYLLITLLVILCLVSCNPSKNQKTDWDEYNLKGKVQTLCIKNYDAKESFGELTKGDLKDSIIVIFSKDGKREQIIENDINGEISKSLFTYEGNIVTEDIYKNDSLYRKHVTTYTDFGEIEKEIFYDATGKMKWCEDYIYSNKRQLEEKNISDDEGLWRKYKNYEFNDKGLVKKVKKYNKTGELVEIEFFKYDEHGREIKSKEEDKDGNIGHTITYTYNKEGFQSSFSYDCKYFNHKYEYTYEYDKLGNYVIMRTNGRLGADGVSGASGRGSESGNSIQERTIQYY